MLVEVAEMVLAELAGEVALGLEQLGDGDVARLQTFLGAGQTDLEHAGAEAGLAGDEARAAGGAALLAIPVGEHRAFLDDAINVGRLVAHLTVVVGADIPPADVVAPQDEDVGFLGGGRRFRRLGGQHGAKQSRRRDKRSEGGSEGFMDHVSVS